VAPPSMFLQTCYNWHREDVTGFYVIDYVIVRVQEQFLNYLLKEIVLE
jgi:hypothetical protein